MKAILFGSYAKGNYGVDSDIDLAIFSDSFRGMERVESIKYLLRKARKYRGIDIQPISFTKQDYEERIGIVGEVLKTGIELSIN
ncbi:MAG: nucleotidyltransferase domain-containing protein [Clostridia bacterium]